MYLRDRKIGKRGEQARRVLFGGPRPGYSGLWRYHATKGWRKVWQSSLIEPTAHARWLYIIGARA